MGLLSAAGALGSAGAGVRGAALSLRDLPGVARVAAGVLGGWADGPRVGDRDGAWDRRGRSRASADRGRVGVPETTVRGWLRRLRARAARLRALFVRLALRLGAQTGRSPPPERVLAWLLDAIATAHRVARELLGAAVARCVWSFSSAASGGLWLANTDAP
jgi:hypothetical protein